MQFDFNEVKSFFKQIFAWLLISFLTSFDNFRLWYADQINYTNVPFLSFEPIVNRLEMALGPKTDFYVYFRNKVLGNFEDRQIFTNMLGEIMKGEINNDDLLELIGNVRKYHPDLLSLLFYECLKAFRRDALYEIIRIDPLIKYRGWTFAFFVSHWNELRFADHLLQIIEPVLHIRDQYGRSPMAYIKSKEISCTFDYRNLVEKAFYTRPFPKEVDLYINYNRLKFNYPEIFEKEREFTFNPDGEELKMKVSRKFVLRDSYRNIKLKHKCWYRFNLYSNFFIGFLGEPGIDEGGVTQEWFSLLIESFFVSKPGASPETFTAPLFKTIADSDFLYAPTNFYKPEVYKFAGSIVAENFKLGNSLGVKFIPSIYRAIFDIERYRVEDLKLQSPKIYSNLMKLKENSEEGQRARELLDLELEMVDVYIEKYAGNLLYRNYRKSIEAFAEGINCKISQFSSQLFIPEELEVLLLGTVEIKIQDFMRSIRCEIINTLIQAIMKFKILEFLKTFSSRQLMKFVTFVTGRRTLPYGGISEIKPPITLFFSATDPGKLPKVATCYAQITFYLPNKLRSMEDALIFALDNCDTLDLA